MTNENTSKDAGQAHQGADKTKQQQNAPTANLTNSAGNAPAKVKTSGLGIAALVLGILAIIGSWIPILNNISGFIAFIGAILGIIGIVMVVKSKGAKSGKGVAIAGTIISIIAIVVVFATQSLYSSAIDTAANSASESLDKAAGNATDELLKNDVSVDFGEYTVEDKTYYKSGQLNVTVTNKASEAKSYTIQIEAVDASGNRIEDGYAYVNKLQSGQSETQELFMAMTDDKVAQFQGASFKVVSVSQY